MPLISGPGSVEKNVRELMTGTIGPARKKAIKTIAEKMGVSKDEARFISAINIAKHHDDPQPKKVAKKP